MMTSQITSITPTVAIQSRLLASYLNTLYCAFHMLQALRINSLRICCFSLVFYFLVPSHSVCVRVCVCGMTLCVPVCMHTQVGLHMYEHSVLVEVRGQFPSLPQLRSILFF